MIFFQNKSIAFADNDVNNILSKYISRESEKKSAPLKAAGKKFLSDNAKKPGIKSMPEGWQYEVLKASDSKEFPLTTDKVKCHYKGTLIDGTVFDNSYDRGEPAVFPLNGVIRGWTIALQKMNVGSKWKIYLPSDLGYGDNGTGDKIGPGATLIFEVELLGIEK
jgi:FKBP-type peptidyl-prolyl cis-trans isomerase FklB